MILQRIKRTCPLQCNRFTHQLTHSEIKWLSTIRHRTHFNIIEHNTTTKVINPLKCNLIRTCNCNQTDSISLPIRHIFIIGLQNHPFIVWRTTIQHTQCVAIASPFILCVRETKNWLEQFCQIQFWQNKTSDICCGLISTITESNSLSATCSTFGIRQIARLNGPKIITYKLILCPCCRYSILKIFV